MLKDKLPTGQYISILEIRKRSKQNLALEVALKSTADVQKKAILWSSVPQSDFLVS